MGRKRIKKISEEQFKEIQKRKWAPVVVLKNKIPELLKNIPNDIYEFALASGSLDPDYDYENDYSDGNKIVGGIDVFRNAPDDPVNYNKDHYTVLEHNTTDGMLLVKGPDKETGHWLDDLPTTSGLEILGYAPKV